MTIHWCGTGLSSAPGLRRLAESGADLVVWNRTVEKARAVVGDLCSDIRAFDADALRDALRPGDVVVSMLPGDWHIPLAETAIDKGTHFVSSSYVSPEMAALDGAAKTAGVALVNEVGLDPGLDHVMAHWLMADYRASDAFDPASEHRFLSYCGGVPAQPNDFRYKFSWSPLGVLKALRSPSRSIRGGAVTDVARPWDALSSYAAPLPSPESFEVYPNRDSLPFLAEYGFGDDWNMQEFVRGTLRLNGWSDAWADVFAEIETLHGPEGDARLQEMSDGFWAAHAYDAGEPDRVVLCVDLMVGPKDAPVYHKTFVLDATGDARGSAMARLVSVPVSLAVEGAAAGQIAPGVSTAPRDAEAVAKWLDVTREQAQHVAVVDHL
ncbi:saccharopine dehydrogenase [Actibacterium mucosum KCTC 23349]|uniref:Saccharopine dehydrogenase n=1 Tax=Actibacterium mucosum KCTC 23349 TaxID=1454373 RepID=A0A037ZN70_9RHOB|nr:saccharopine dehydrogenase family protein [Actibacterium mucosum]KAJ57529.1 saccharopine dehydrogenase [Actibacterium mucosum KCTC 23349]